MAWSERPVRRQAASADRNHEVLIMRYAGDRLYDTGTARYLTVNDINRMRGIGCVIVIREASSGEDITKAVLERPRPVGLGA